jgi:outer membrane receptor for ferrienterochelin and colicin
MRSPNHQQPAAGGLRLRLRFGNARAAASANHRARADQRQRETTTSIVIDHADIVRQGDQALSDVLKRLPGVSIKGNAIQMRGLGNGYTQILLNGEPVASGFSLDAIAPETIERIEILRSATAEMSNQAVAGAINIILKRPCRAASAPSPPALHAREASTRPH